ncbi:hypothetical protein NDU88_010081 [Pleurodeles waltl]|uniref:Uncharacterized protein n=1 Tax=Pleurodeles waltl TaxID=8319 RepID=A0AAV7S2W4_PLEWA|nr:hypothetical protein NDU88_010081 [Pleurodeles waltl]
MLLVLTTTTRPNGPRLLAQDPNRCCKPPAVSGRELLMGALDTVQILPWVFGPPGPHRFDHAAAPHFSPNVALWVAASSPHQFGVSDCRDRDLRSKSLVISAKRGPVPQAAAILVF